jgi:ferredoxin--NADP+ reductase
MAPETQGPGASKHQRAEIVWRKDHAPDLWSIRLRPLEEPVRFTPGQYLTLGLQAGERIVERAYSIVSSPAEPEVELFFELVPHGALTPLLHALKPGDEVLVRRRVKGSFTTEALARPNLMLVCTVTGVAPFVSMLRAGAAPEARIFLLHSGSRSTEMGYREELEEAARRSPRLTYLPSVSRTWEDPDWRGELGRCEDVLRKHLDTNGLRPENTAVYLCGHPGMIESCKGILLRAGFARDDLHVEAYWMPPKAPAAGRAAP